MSRFFLILTLVLAAPAMLHAESERARNFVSQSANELGASDGPSYYEDMMAEADLLEASGDLVQKSHYEEDKKHYEKKAKEAAELLGEDKWT